MALQKEYWEMHFGTDGQEQRTEEKVVESPKLTELINGEIIEPGSIQKRTGYKALESSPEDSYNLEYGRKCERNGALVSYSDYKIAGYNPKTGWGDVNTSASPTSRIKKIFSDFKYDFSGIDFAYIQQSGPTNYYVVYAKRTIHDQTGTTSVDHAYYVFDEEFNFVTEGVILTELFGHTYSNIEMVAAGSSQPYIVYFFWIDDTDLECKKVYSDSIFSIDSSPTTLATDAVVGSVLAACNSTNNMYLAYNSSNYLKLIRTQNGTSIANSWDASGEGTPANYNADGAIAITVNDQTTYPSLDICVAFDANNVSYNVFLRVVRFGATLSAIVNTNTVSSTADACLGAIIGTGTTSTSYLILLDVTYLASTHYLPMTEVFFYTGTALYGQTSTEGCRIENCHTRHRPIGNMVNDRGPFFGLQSLIENFRVEFTCELRTLSNSPAGALSICEPIAKYNYRMTSGIAEEITDQRYKPNIREIATNVYAWATTDANNNILICYFDLSHLVQKRFQSIKYKESLFLAQSIPLIFDAYLAKEIGFSCPPYISYATPVGSGSIPAGDYNYIAIYKQVDNQGNVYRSQVSNIETVTVPGSPNSLYIEIWISGAIQRIGYRSDDWESANNPVIEIYRTEEGPGSIFYKIEPILASYGYGSNFCIYHTTNYSQWFRDSTLDADLIENEVLYINSGELEHCAPPPLDWITQYNNRLWGIDSETGNIPYSAELIEGEGPWFNPSMVVEGETDSGKPTALIPSPSGLMIFWPHKIGAVYGEGANRLGSAGSLTKPHLIADNIGCIEVNSIVQTPKGIIFKDSNGFHLMRYDANEPIYIGGGAYDYDSEEISSASLIHDKKQVRFTLQGPTYYGILVYSYEFDIWSYWGATDSGDYESPKYLDDHYGGCAIDNTHYIGLSNGNTLYQTTDEYQDGYIASGPSYASAQYGFVVQTAWIKLTGLQGFKRVLRAWILGEYIDDHDMDVYIDYDYNEDNRDTVSFSNSELDGLSPYQVRVGIPRQRCEAIRFRIVIDTRSYTHNAGAKLNGIRLEYMRQPGGMRSVKRN